MRFRRPPHYPLCYEVLANTPILSRAFRSVLLAPPSANVSRVPEVAMPGKKKFGEGEAEPDRDHCPKCGVKLTQGEKDSERCRNGHTLS